MSNMCICMCMYFTFIQHDLPRKFHFPTMFKSHLQPVHMHCSVGHPAATAAVAPSLAEPRLRVAGKWMMVLLTGYHLNVI